MFVLLAPSRNLQHESLKIEPVRTKSNMVSYVFFENDDEPTLFVCNAPTIATLLENIRKNFSYVFDTHDTPKKRLGPKDIKKLKWSIGVFDAEGHRLSAASYHAARGELTVRCTKLL
jgi:hypothetical protein